MFSLLCRRNVARASSTTTSVARRWLATAGGGAPTLTFAVNHDDLKFVLHDVHKMANHYQSLGFKEVDESSIDMVAGEVSKFGEEVLAPMYQRGDREGCERQADGTVRTPSGWKEAYDSYREGGWQALSVSEKYSGQGMPQSLSLMKAEIVGTANWAWGMYPGLALGAANTLALHGTEQQKQTYLSKLAEGTWLGTMCLTEPHCGTDLGQMTTKAVPASDGSYKITGTKIFISCGEHSWTENIIHIVLARLPDSPKGTKGISLFIVPKYLPNKDGTLSTTRNIMCGGIEHKMGIHGSSTCVMNFDNSVGFLIGEPNKGLNYMFTFMNTARIGTAIQGLGACELAYQNSVRYAKERMSSRALRGTVHPDRAADLLIAHGDVRRMLLTQRAFAEGGRSLLYRAAKIADSIYLESATKESIEKVEHHLGLFTPILKGFMTEVGQESASIGMQTWGGHGYVRDNGMEQIYRDARIATLYEGTTGIQALDLLGRKVMQNKGKLLFKFIGELSSTATSVMRANIARPMSPQFRHAAQLNIYALRWAKLTVQLLMGASRNKEVASSAANDFLMYAGYVSLAHEWLIMEREASRLLALGGRAPPAFYEAKLHTADFYFANLLPRALAHAKSMTSGAETVLRMPEQSF